MCSVVSAAPSSRYPSGRSTWIETIKTPVLGGNGDVIGTAGIARDIETRKGMEAALRVMFEAEGWDYGRCMKVEDGALARMQDGWLAREPAVEQFLEPSVERRRH